MNGKNIFHVSAKIKGLGMLSGARQLVYHEGGLGFKLQYQKKKEREREEVMQRGEEREKVKREEGKEKKRSRGNKAYFIVEYFQQSVSSRNVFQSK